jgi:transcriptional regulator with XRE-family HTH domain
MSSGLGPQIRRARERRRWTQQQLADALDVGLRTVGGWERGEAVPRNSIGALEDVLGISLAGDAPAEVYSDPGEALIWSWQEFTETERHAMIATLREVRNAPARHGT